MKYLVGARGSKLSVAQTNWVISELKKVNPDSEYEIKVELSHVYMYEKSRLKTKKHDPPDILSNCFPKKNL